MLGAQVALVLAVSVILGVVLRQGLRSWYLTHEQAQMHELLGALARALPDPVPTHWCAESAAGATFRLTVISSAQGRPLCDSAYGSSHGAPSLLGRPEVEEALKAGGFGSTARFSRTLGEDSLYAARALPRRGVVLRVGRRLTDLERLMKFLDHVVLVLVAALGAGVGLALWVTGRRMLFPLAEEAVVRTTAGLRADFVANVSHELRTPLTAIKGFADTMAADLAAGRKPEARFVGIIGSNAARLLSLINDLLDLSALDEGRLRIEPGPVGAKEATEAVLAQLGPALAERGQRAQIVIEGTAGDLWADGARLHQVLVNLIDNARKYSVEGGTITVRWKPMMEGGRAFVELSVEDEGPGIDAEHQARLFERFYRAEGSRSRQQGGSGLGLSIVKHILESHGGAVGVDSAPGKSTRFWCRFPEP